MGSAVQILLVISEGPFMEVTKREQGGTGTELVEGQSSAW